MKFLTLIIILLLPIVCVCQKQNDSLFFVNMETRIVDYAYKPESIASIPFKDLQVLDSRTDTTSIGFSKLNGVIKKANFKNGLASEVYTYANSDYIFHTQASDTNSLLIIIKNFRTSNYAGETLLKENNTIDWNAGVIINIEAFLFNGKGYHALYKVDTIYITEAFHSYGKNIYTDIFQPIFSKIENKAFKDIHVGKTEFSKEQLQNHINDFSNFPILKDTVLVKGIYKNFNEFKTNNPSIKDFEFIKGKLSSELYVTDNNQSYPLQNCWGYCDGKNIFINSANNFFQLYKVGNTYNSKAFKSLEKRENSLAPTLLNTMPGVALLGSAFGLDAQNIINQYKGLLSVFQLDMQTGEIF